MEDIMNKRGCLEFQTASVVLLWAELNEESNQPVVLHFIIQIN